MDIIYCIGELLYSNDCVILPGFGGFVTHYVPASIHPINHTFNPPSKSILFNSKLVRDDGLLLDFIAEKEGLTYADVKIRVAEFVNEVTNKLRSGETVVFNNIGSLKHDPQGNLLFNPDGSVNYLEESFGLPSFVSQPVIRKPLHKRLETTFIDRKPTTEKRSRRKRAVWATAAVLPVLLVFGWFIFFGDILPDNTQKTGIVTLPDTELNEDKDANNPNNADSYSPEGKNPPLESLDFSDTDLEKPENTTTPEDTPPEPVVIQKQYYIIGGAFGVEANADKYVATLRQNGWDAKRAGLSPNGFHMVSYMSTVDKNEALLNLAMIRKDGNPGAWLMKK